MHNYSLPPLSDLQSTPKSVTTSEQPSSIPEITTKPSTTEKVTTTLSPTTTPPTTTQPPVCAMPEKPAQQAGAIGFGYDLNSHVMYTITQASVLSKLISKK